MDTQLPTEGLPSSLFEKYKQGLAHHLAPFRLFPAPPLSFATSMSTSGEEMDSHSADDDPTRKTRGPYRKYTCREKMEAVERVRLLL